ncbi:hypothetical protein LCGC14_0456430 [marine sediment metagenome]|uniref:L-glutamate gamma-semialdehyde dehydrogenase n=1 Tax=marine sediment metagenome TaxID=412755 RepID=A0A0F9VQ98_9ZZZZ|nr:L-glutamate gamma-semialdehyde dehydrogenase [Phycisphaerae bacterium]
MNDRSTDLQVPTNEPVLSYGPGSPERDRIRARLKSLKAETVEIPVVAGGREIRTGQTGEIHPPHELAHTLGVYHKAQGEHVRRAIDAALAARGDWSRMSLDQRAAIFLTAADLLAGPWRDTLNAATMLGQSKNVFQAEIDAACELIDFLRFNVHFARLIEAQQPFSPDGVINRMDYRPLEGFVFALPPFNFTSILCNLPTAPAIMGCTVVWKPASAATYSSWLFYQLLRQAGLPDGVINFVPGDGPIVGPAAVASQHLAGLHFTGSAEVFQQLWRSIGENIGNYRSYPRVVGETGGKDFIVAHVSADVDALATAMGRGAFEYQGQKCSAASRAYIPESLWPRVAERLLADVAAMKMGTVEEFTNFMNAVIDAKAFNRITGAIDAARADSQTEVLIGGGYSDSEGYFIEPTVLRTRDPKSRWMCEEIFGPVLTVYVYPDDQYAETLALADTTSPYGLTGAVFAQDRAAVEQAADALRDAAGNFYINDKPSGAVVNQQPFGGGRASGTDDKAGSWLNLTRWTAPRAIKENLNPPTDFTYPFLQPD